MAPRIELAAAEVVELLDAIADGTAVMTAESAAVASAAASPFAELDVTELALSAADGPEDAGVAAREACPALRDLFLGGTAVTDEGLARLERFPALRYLNVQKTKVTAEGVAKFRAACPGCKVEWDGPK